MSDPQTLIIDVNETFPQLRRSPLIEAVIHWQAHATKELEPETLKAELTQRLPDYRAIQIQYEHGIHVETPLQPDGSTAASAVEHRTQWIGLRLENEYKNRVVQFTKTGIAISSVGNYESWTTFHQEALNLWSLFYELAEPRIINRLGVRYINKILIEEGEKPSTYLKTVQKSNFNPSLKRDTFFYQETYKVLNHPYSINWVCTQQSEANQQFLIVDIDVFISPLPDLKKSSLIEHLNKIRWLKNTIFFNSITNTALEKFGG
ncbi:TIGR04255 family protein [Spirulina sp. 06S082]|uniref:TIGR04255 family protein n=1 Tax=Spirulina sp. 06S082 TaxID=3110248 RepID=UPI002B20CFB6|nr:TIGR04255 family protein [Spirulina sp. 06S082]MEA5468589.1 TIGR04255 family protein [Spirulina sp. 06S082]